MSKSKEKRVINQTAEFVNPPDPMRIMKTLVSLYADQMGVTISCVIEAGGKSERFTTK